MFFELSDNRSTPFTYCYLVPTSTSVGALEWGGGGVQGVHLLKDIDLDIVQFNIIHESSNLMVPSEWKIMRNPFGPPSNDYCFLRPSFLKSLCIAPLLFFKCTVLMAALYFDYADAPSI